MAKKGGMVRIYGFDEFLQKLVDASGSGVDEMARKCFDACSDIVVDAMNEKMQKANVPASLQNKTTRFRVVNGNTYMFTYGWSKGDEDTFKKICYLNYGTPRRETKKGANRGKVDARYFISNAKRSAAQKMRKVQKDSLDEFIKGLS